MASNNRPTLKRQSSLLPRPKSPNREDNLLIRDAVDKDSDEEYVFSAVAAAMEVHYDEKIILYAITGEKATEAETTNSKKEGPNECGAKKLV